MDKMREEFEAQMRSIGMFEQGGDAMAPCEETGGYADPDTNAMWAGFQIGWQASRAAMCVKLPCTPDFNASDEPEFGFDSAIESVKVFLDDAGVRYE